MQRKNFADRTQNLGLGMSVSEGMLEVRAFLGTWAGLGLSSSDQPPLGLRRQDLGVRIKVCGHIV
jgi:hypothetical protein